MINHLADHASVDADVFSRDKVRLVGTEIEHHVGNVQRIADTSDGLLNSIGAFIECAGCIYPARRDGVDTDTSGKADGQGMSL